MITSSILAIVGLMFLIWWRPIAAWVYKIQRPWLNAMFSWAVNIDSPWFRKSYNVAALAIGILLILFALANYFGPIVL